MKGEEITLKVLVDETTLKRLEKKDLFWFLKWANKVPSLAHKFSTRKVEICICSDMEVDYEDWIEK